MYSNKLLNNAFWALRAGLPKPQHTTKFRSIMLLSVLFNQPPNSLRTTVVYRFLAGSIGFVFPKSPNVYWFLNRGSGSEKQ